MRLSIRSDQRVAIIGKTGTGKTYLAERLTAPLRRLVIVDPNGVLAARFQPHIPWEKGLDAFREGRDARLYISLSTPDSYEPIWNTIYEVGHTVVYIDEAYGVTPPGKLSKGLWQLYTRGRALGIGVWASTQRPRHIPMVMLSEAEWFFVFRVMLPEDREFLSKLIHPALIDPPPVHDEHGFYYYHIGWEKPRYARKLEGS